MSESGPSDRQLLESLREILRTGDLEKLTPKSVRNQLESEFDCSLRSKRKWLKEQTQLIVQELEGDEGEEEAPEKPKKEKRKKAAAKKGKLTGSKRKAPEKGGSGGGRGNAFQRPMAIRPDLLDLLGGPEEDGKYLLSRPQVVKKLWEYIREHSLQDPENKQVILLDQPLRDIFQRNEMTMFTMNRYLKSHILSPDEVDFDKPLDPQFPPRFVEDPSEEEKAAKKAKKAAAAKRRKTGSRGGSKRGSGIHKPQTLSDELSDVLKVKYMSRSQTMKALWGYIHAHNLQNPEDKRQIRCDAVLESLFGQPKVTMFEIPKLLQRHFVGEAPPDVVAAAQESESSEASSESESED